MRRRMSKPRDLIVRYYAARMIDLNDYLTACPGGKAIYNIGETEMKNPFEYYAKLME